MNVWKHVNKKYRAYIECGKLESISGCYVIANIFHVMRHSLSQVCEVDIM